MGVILDITSPSGGLIAMPQVMQLAVDDMNAGLTMAGGYKEIAFAQTTNDSQGMGPTASAFAATMVQRGAKIVLSGTARDTIAIMRNDYDDDPTNDLNAPILCLLCGTPTINSPVAVDPDPITQAALRNDKKWNFRVIESAKYFPAVWVGRMLAVTGGGDRNGDGVVKVSLYGSNEVQGQASVNGFAAALLAVNPAASIEKIFHDPAADPNGPLWAMDAGRLTDNFNETTNIADGLPDMVFESSLPETAIAITRAYVLGNYGIPLLHGAPFGNETATIALGALANGQEGVGFATYYPGPSADFFIQRYLGHFGAMPESHERDGATTYDAVMLGALATMVAVKDMPDPSQVTGAQIRDAMWKVNDSAGTEILAGPDGIAKAAPLIAAGMPINYRGVSGPLDFDENAFVVGAMAHWVISNGHFVDQDLYDCTHAVPCPLYT